MRSPSPRVLINRCNIYRVTGNGRDADGGVTFPYPSTPTYPQEPCTIQGRATEVLDEQRRITQLTVYQIIFGRSLNVGPRDMVIYSDASGVTRTLFVESIEDMAGRGAAWRVYAQERQ